MKQCSICKLNKELTEFNKHSSRKDKLQSHCRDCNKERSKAYYKHNHDIHRVNVRRRNKEVSQEYASKLFSYLQKNPCVECGEPDPVVLEFDHVDANTKLFSVSDAIRRCVSWNRIEEEIKKCRVLCANCHRRRTAKQFGWTKAKLASLA